MLALNALFAIRLLQYLQYTVGMGYIFIWAFNSYIFFFI
jgi:hypothetical protein